MCRLIGIAADYHVAPHIIMSLSTQGYAGEESCGVAIEGSRKFAIETGTGMASEVFSRFRSKDYPGKMGIGHVACKTGGIQPIIIERTNRPIALCADASNTVCQTIAEMLGCCQDIQKAIKEAMFEIKEPFALLVLLPSGKIIAARNNGRMPLTFGKLVNSYKGFYVASQSGVLGLDAEFIHGIFPGEMVVLDRDGYQRKAILANPDLTRCCQEPLFWQRPGNYCANRDTNSIRQAVGRKLGGKFRKRVQVEDPQEYIAIPILEGGATVILGFGQTAGVPINPAGSVKSRYHKSSFMPPHMDLFPIADVVRGKRVIIVDEALISGGQLEVMVKRSLEYGAEEVHAVIGTIVRRSCPFGKDIIVDHSKSVKNLIQNLNLASFTDLTPKEIIEAIDTPHRIYCTQCLEA